MAASKTRKTAKIGIIIFLVLPILKNIELYAAVEHKRDTKSLQNSMRYRFVPLFVSYSIYRRAPTCYLPYRLLIQTRLQSLRLHLLEYALRHHPASIHLS